ncbi:BrnT family toxin [Burkholderia pseudomallei]|uniref:BrnT family toxin n=1 Tax=Burkholderia pseudomallei TaxID=28450 RepID=UPI002155E85F|nr:BrnT family toxin [Burkholderia pseudomallei]
MAFETIKACAECTELHGQPSTIKPKHLVMVGAGVFQGECREEHYECSTCGAAFGVIGDRLYCVVFTQRGDSMHIISMRKANKREVKSYVEQA